MFSKSDINGIPEYYTRINLFSSNTHLNFTSNKMSLMSFVISSWYFIRINSEAPLFIWMCLIKYMFVFINVVCKSFLFRLRNLWNLAHIFRFILLCDNNMCVQIEHRMISIFTQSNTRICYPFGFGLANVQGQQLSCLLVCIPFPLRY